MIDRDAVLKIRLFDDLSNSLSSIGSIRVVRILCLYVNAILIKQYVKTKSMRAWKEIF